MPYAYDPVRGEDVKFDRCHPVHAAESADDLGDHVVEIITRSFVHDPVEACQGHYTLLVEGECPGCGCNRLRSSHDTMGIGALVCPACERVVEQG